MAASKVGLQSQTSDGCKDDGEVPWGKDIYGFPERRTYGDSYKDWRNTMKGKMGQDSMQGGKGTMAIQ